MVVGRLDQMSSHVLTFWVLSFDILDKSVWRRTSLTLVSLLLYNMHVKFSTCNGQMPQEVFMKVMDLPVMTITLMMNPVRMKVNKIGVFMKVMDLLVRTMTLMMNLVRIKVNKIEVFMKVMDLLVRTMTLMMNLVKMKINKIEVFMKVMDLPVRTMTLMMNLVRMKLNKIEVFMKVMDLHKNGPILQSMLQNVNQVLKYS